MTAHHHKTGFNFRLLRKIAPGIEAFSKYQPSWLRSDIAAGLSVAAVALPVGIAYADLAGVPAVYGMYAAIFPLFAYALFGSSKQLMTGPDAATCLMVAASLGPLAGGDPQRYQALMAVLTLATGVIYVLAGIGRFGFIANFLSFPILTGFLNGVALIIIFGQLPKLFGYSVGGGNFFPQLFEIIQNIGKTHRLTLLLGLAMLIGLVGLRRLVPKLPNPLLIVVLGIGLVMVLGLDTQGVAVLGNVPAGFPGLIQFPTLNVHEVGMILRDASALVLVSFTSGILTAKSFAQRNHYSLDSNRELIGFGTCNIASGLVQGFPVTGADSRTAVNDAMGGKSQLVGIIAGCAMLLVLFFLTKPLAFVPHAALAAVIIVSAFGLFDIPSLRELYSISRIEFYFSICTTFGVLLLGVLPGVLLAVVLSLLMLLAESSKPHDEVLGRVAGRGFHDCNDFTTAETISGLLLYRFDANLVFYNADYFKERVLEEVLAAEMPVEWVVVDASSINVVDVSAIKKIEELRADLEKQDIVLAVANQKHMLTRHFQGDWLNTQRQMSDSYNYPSLTVAVRAFNERKKLRKG